MFRHLKCHPQGTHCDLLKLRTCFSGLSEIRLLKYKMIDTGQARPQHQQRLHIQPLRTHFITLYNQHFIEDHHFIF